MKCLFSTPCPCLPRFATYAPQIRPALPPMPQNPAAAQAAEQVALLQEWVELLRTRDEADAAAAAAQVGGEVKGAATSSSHVVGPKRQQTKSSEPVGLSPPRCFRYQ